MQTFEEEWRARFERFARRHEADHLVSGWSPGGLERRVTVFQELVGAARLPRGASALDLGCGAGTYVRLLVRLGHCAIGLDYSLPTLGRAVAADPGGRGRYLAGDAYVLPFRAEAFDLVIAIGVMQALARPDRALDEMARVLRRNGVLVVEALNRRAVPARVRQLGGAITGTAPRVRSYDPREVRDWLDERGLAVVRQAGVFLPPRSAPGLARLLALRHLASRAAPTSALAEAAAHTFLFLARKA